ncbi:MAG: universal stress protein [Thermomicrobiales bacterium]
MMIGSALHMREQSMFGTLIVPVDGTPTSEAALPVAAELAHATGAALVLVRVTDTGDTPEQAMAHAYLARLAASDVLRGLAVTSSVRQGEPAAAIDALARDAGADLIVMATHGRAGLARALLGSVTEQALAHSSVPVVVLRAGAQALAPLTTILVPVDATPGSMAALAVASTLAGATGARLALVQVVPPLARWGRGWGIALGWEEEVRETAQQALDSLAARLRQQGRVADGYARVGAIAPTIAALAAETSADLIVMGTHAFTGPKRALLGSIADEVVRKAAQPVLLVRQVAANE